MRECARVLVADGTLIISTPNRPVYRGEYGQNPFHLIEFDQDEFVELLRTHFNSVRLYTQFPRSVAWWSVRSLAAEHSPWLKIKGFWRLSAWFCPAIRSDLSPAIRAGPSTSFSLRIAFPPRSSTLISCGTTRPQLTSGRTSWSRWLRAREPLESSRLDPKPRVSVRATLKATFMTTSGSPPIAERPTPPILRRLWRGTFWLALKAPLQVIIAFWSVPLIQQAIGAEANGAYVFAWGFGFIQFLLEFGVGTALQRQVTLAWTRGDRDGVNRLIASGLVFYGCVAIFQMSLLLAIAYFGLPAKFQGEARRMIIQLLWVQALSAPFFGLVTLASCVLQAASRYEIVPRLDLLLMVTRFAILVVGLRLGANFVAIIAAQTVVYLAGILLPLFWIVFRELGCVPHFAAPGRGEYATLFRVGFFVFMMQVSVVLADKVDTTILGYALPENDPGPSITIYQNVSRPFLQIRQTGWTLAYLVIPAVASLAAARDVQSLDQLKYDGTRLLVGLLLPVTLLAGIYAAPFLHLWVGPRYVPYAWLLQLFLVATAPLILSVAAQMAIGLGKYEVVSLSPLVGSLVNLPLSYYLTTRLGVSGVIWGTVLTTLVSNLLVPGAYLVHILEIRAVPLLVRHVKRAPGGSGPAHPRGVDLRGPLTSPARRDKRPDAGAAFVCKPDRRQPGLLDRLYGHQRGSF